MSAESVKAHPGHELEIHINNKPVLVEGPRLTGLAIKEAAIAQGIPIQLDFLLSEDGQHGGSGDPVGDDQLVTVNKNSRFTAVAPDDNS